MQRNKSPKKITFQPARKANVAALADYQTGSIVSREILKGPTGRVSLFAFDEGEALSEHTSPFNALVQIVEGEAEIAIAGKAHHVKAGEVILMPAQQPHAVKALRRFKMILTMILP